MRIRFKKWARPELEASNFYIDTPEEYKGKWNELFERKQPLYLELGCGKGGFISQTAPENLNKNYIAIDLVDAMLGLAKRKIEEAYSVINKKPDNIYITRYDIDRILNIFDEKDNIERIYINFCNPWPKAKHNKRRLTHPRQLEQYKTFLKDGGEIYFKTDDDELFTASLDYFEEAGFKIINKTLDLHSEDIFEGNIETEHEKMFTEQGINIKALIAQKTNY